MKSHIHNYFIMVICSVFVSSCAVYYDAKEQSAYIPNVVNQNATNSPGDFSTTFYAGLNHLENQCNYRLNDNLSLQANTYISRGFKLYEVGTTHHYTLSDRLRINISPGLSFGDMDYDRSRTKTDGSSGSSYSTFYTKTESIGYHFYRGYVNPSFGIKLHEKIQLEMGARISYTKFAQFNYYFYNEKKYFSKPDTLEFVSIKNKDQDRASIEPYISIHLQPKKVGVFFQLLYYGSMGNYINSNTQNIMSRANIPILMSAGLSLNLNFYKK